MDNLNSDVNNLRSCLKASKIKSIDGMIRGRDGNPMKPMRRVVIDEKENSYDDVGRDTSDCGDEVNNANKFNSGPTHSFASIVQNKSVKQVVRVKELRSNVSVDGAAVAIPVEAVVEVSSRFENTLYGYFIGSRLAFPI
nr:hypothetical protein [Tanacetum cinerariifolium]